jgi:hypothetical protein
MYHCRSKPTWAKQPILTTPTKLAHWGQIARPVRTGKNFGGLFELIRTFLIWVKVVKTRQIFFDPACRADLSAIVSPTTEVLRRRV